MSHNNPHRRYDPLADKWILLSQQRLSRPWQGEVGEPEEPQPPYDAQCYLCPGNKRVGGETNPDYQGVHIFPNDFPALLPESAAPKSATEPLFQSEVASGECHVICFSPDHGKSLPLLTDQERRGVVDSWCAESERLGQNYSHIQVFENKGAMMGCSNPHPHGQIWASFHVPDSVLIEDRTQADYLAQHDSVMLLDVAEQEIAKDERVIVCNQHWVAIIPWWASWPFETLLIPRFHAQRLPDLESDQRQSLAMILGELTTRYDNLFRCSFPYSMGWHGAPFGQTDPSHWQIHAHFYPPLLRSSSVRKFMVGYEMLAEAQRDLTPEQATEMLRSVPGIHYRNSQ